MPNMITPFQFVSDEKELAKIEVEKQKQSSYLYLLLLTTQSSYSPDDPFYDAEEKDERYWCYCKGRRSTYATIIKYLKETEDADIINSRVLVQGPGQDITKFVSVYAFCKMAAQANADLGFDIDAYASSKGMTINESATPSANELQKDLLSKKLLRQEQNTNALNSTNVDNVIEKEI